MARTGRPRIEIDKEEFEKLCGIHCTEEDIAGWFKCHVDTIAKWCKRTYKETFPEVFKKHSATGKVSIRRHQFEAMQKGNTAMLIWLGKQYLGQKDQVEIPISGDVTLHLNIGHADSNAEPNAS